MYFRRLQFIIFSLLLVAAVFSYIFSKITIAEVLAAISGISLIWLMLFVFFSLSSSVFRTWRYHLVLNVSGYQTGSMALFLVTLVRNVFSDLLPARLGTLVYIYLVKSRLGVPFGPAMSSFAHAFIFDIISLAILLLPAVLLVGFGSGSGIAMAGISLVLGLVSYILLSLLPRLSRGTADMVQKIALLPSGWRQGLHTGLDETAHQLERVRQHGMYWKILALSFGVRCCKYLSLYVLLLGLVLPLGFATRDFPLARVFLGLCSAELATSLPISGIAGFGAYEGAWSLVFQLLGYEEKIAVLTSISHHLITQIYDYSLGALAALLLLLPLFRQGDGMSCQGEKQAMNHFWKKFALITVCIASVALFLFQLGEGGGSVLAKTFPG